MGYVAFSPVTVEGEELQWVGLAPLAVDESYRGQGIGRQLVYEGLDSLNEFGYAAVVTLGEPALYGRLGFEPAAAFDLRCRWPDTAEAFRCTVWRMTRCRAYTVWSSTAIISIASEPLQQGLERTIPGNEALFLALR